MIGIVKFLATQATRLVEGFVVTIFRCGTFLGGRTIGSNNLHGCGLSAINSSGHMPPLYAQANAGVEVRDSGMVNRS